MFFLRVPQQSDEPTGGSSLLGSIVEEEYETTLGIRHGWYPVPFHVSRPGLIRDWLMRHAEELELPSNPVHEVRLAPTAQVVSVKATGGGSGSGVGPFPAVPAGLGIHLDYSRMSRLELALGQGTRVKHIPFEYMVRMYQHVGGDHKAILPSGYIARANIIDRVLLSREWSIRFESSSDIGSGLAAKLQESVERNPPLGLDVRYEKTGERSITATVRSEWDYLMALHKRNWSDFRCGRAPSRLALTAVGDGAAGT